MERLIKLSLRIADLLHTDQNSNVIPQFLLQLQPNNHKF
jgi:hypothetical protein